MSATVSANLYQTLQKEEWEDTKVHALLVAPFQRQLAASAVWRTKEFDSNTLDAIIEDCLTAFPCGHTVTGLVLVASSRLSVSLKAGDIEVVEEELDVICGSLDDLLKVLACGSCLLLCLHKTDETLWEISSLVFDKEGLKPISLSHDSDTDSEVVRFRLRAALPVLVSTESKDAISNQLELQSTKFQTLLQNGSFVYGMDDNKIILLKSGSVQNGAIQKPKSCRDLQVHIVSQEEERGGGGGGTSKGGGKKKASLFKQAPISMSLLEMASCSIPSQSYAPVIAHQVGTFQSVQMSLPIDLLVEVSEDFPVSKLSSLITQGVARQLKALFKSLKPCVKDGTLHPPEAFHFQPPGLNHPVTAVFPQGVSEENLEQERLALHKTFCLPEDRPYFRRSSGNIFLSPTAPGGYLLNTHIGLPDPPVKTATVSVVQGFYSYHHYMQDRFNDDKWGCAYRSLQTIVSWFKYQGYTDRSIPSHREIQQALCDVGDRPEKFVGSRQWIGSIEVGYVLDHLLGVSSKFINVNAGAELSTTGQQLAHHFQQEGTPVMIGGGVLAHTILGVAYDELTGDINFLILDPHYTGGEDLRTIQSKGWCGWKDMKFWNQTAHYNLCLPQRPSMV